MSFSQKEPLCYTRDRMINKDIFQMARIFLGFQDCPSCGLCLSFPSGSLLIFFYIIEVFLVWKRTLYFYFLNIALYVARNTYIVLLVSQLYFNLKWIIVCVYFLTRRMISKSYYQQLRSSERQALVGPPESMREHVVAASKAMRNGDWKKCRDFVINDKMNAKVWDLFYEADKVRAMLARKIQEETLRTYLFTYSKVYNSISIVSVVLFFCA